MKTKNPDMAKSSSAQRRARTIPREEAQFCDRWLKRLLVVHRSDTSLAIGRNGRIHPMKSLTISDAKFIGCKKTSMGEMFALYSIDASRMAFFEKSARRSAIPFGGRAVEKRFCGTWPALLLSPDRSASLDKKTGNDKIKIR